MMDDVSQNPRDYRHVIYENVRYDDLDTYNHVNNKVFLSYIEDARVNYFRSVADISHLRAPVEGVVIARGEIDYLRSILYGDKVRVYSRCARIGTKSYEMHCLVQVERDSLILTVAIAKAIMVSIDPSTGKSIPHPPNLVEGMKSFESPQRIL